MANKSYKTTSWGRRYADVVFCPVRRLWLYVKPGRTIESSWHYEVNDEDGNYLGGFKHRVVPEGSKHRSINSTEFWNKVDSLSSERR